MIKNKKQYYAEIHSKLGEKYGVSAEAIKLVRAGLKVEKISKSELIERNKQSKEKRLDEIQKIMRHIKAGDEAIEILSSWSQDTIEDILNYSLE